jgi:serine/threonine protein kinase
MLYCSNPSCSNPFNPEGNKFCTSCGWQTLKPLFRDRFRVIRLLGEGGFSRTYEARDVDRMDDPCVIKQFLPQVQGTAALEKATELFQREAQQLYQLGEHPQIPRLIAYFEQDKRLYLVQEFIEGQNLLQELQQMGAFNEEKIRQLLADVLPILKLIHERGVIHRDIKPENIMRRRSDGKLVLIDFGVSKQTTPTASGKIGTTVGTPGYTPLEQMRGQVYPASDLYSLGVTCIRLLTQCLLKEDGSDELYDALSGQWVWREYLPKGTTMSHQLGLVLDRLIQDYVKERYQSADAVLAALKNQRILTTPKSPQLSSQYQRQGSSQVRSFSVPSSSPQNLNLPATVDYTKLQYLLGVGRWEDANEETLNVMLKVANREKQGSLYLEDIANFSCQDLSTINKLWIQYSDRRFGFSIQQQIWSSFGGSKNADYETWSRFGYQVGWMRNQMLKHVWFEQLTYSRNAPIGHLPCIEMVRIAGMNWANVLFSRVEVCKLY